MSSKEQPKLKFHGVDIIKVDFESKKFFDSSTNVELDISPKVLFDKKDRANFKILMTARISAEEFFTLNIICFGSFTASEDCDEKMRNQFVNSNAVAIMFPYLRSFITTFSSNLGKPTGRLIIPTRFFQGEIDEIDISEDGSIKEVE